ncbi:hypothetical protein IV203_000292 [Nitzschia inconspicua]|uniref:Uncharacterized protein n=1 Tax=Nitzschia inconspicua TaxID=303405 RepID=A0A9K3L678_9STRA|nr:hypothetical protein IV203_000292 [Nitzschia inconspicua]
MDSASEELAHQHGPERAGPANLTTALDTASPGTCYCFQVIFSIDKKRRIPMLLDISVVIMRTTQFTVEASDQHDRFTLSVC